MGWSATGGLQALYMCEVQASWASVLFFLGCGKCLVLWALPLPEELDGSIPEVGRSAWKVLRANKRRSGTRNRTLLKPPCLWS